MFRFIGTHFSVYRVSMFLASQEDGSLEPFVSEHASGASEPELFDEWLRLDVESFEMVERLRAGEDDLIIDDPYDGSIPADIARRFELKPYIVIALRRADALIGLLMVEGPRRALRRRRDEIAEFAQYLSMALANAQAFAREQQRARDAEALLEVGAELARTSELIPVLASVAQNCARVAGFDRCSVFLADEETGRLLPTMSQFADGHTDEQAWQSFLRADDEIPAARDVLARGVPLAIDDALLSPNLTPSWWVELFGIRSVLFLPLTAWGERFGVLALDRDRVHEISAHQVRIAEGVAAQGAVAIQLSRSLARERAAVARLTELDDLKNTFVATVSHELRTPLTTIIGFGSVLDHHVDDPEAKEYLAIIQRESSHLENMISNLLAISNIEAGALELRRDEVDVGAVVSEAVELIGRLDPDRPFLLEAEQPVIVGRADADRLRQVFTNLLQNAAKYSPPRTPVTITVESDGSDARVSVTDRGAGIPEDQRESIFERFQRADDQGVQGTGIGLYLVRELVEGHGGRVWVETGPEGVGSRFVVVLPGIVTRADAA